MGHFAGLFCEKRTLTGQLPLKVVLAGLRFAITARAERQCSDRHKHCQRTPSIPSFHDPGCTFAYHLSTTAAVKLIAAPANRRAGIVLVSASFRAW